MGIKTATDFIQRYALRHPVYMVTYLATYLLKGFAFKTHFLSEKEIKDAIVAGKSIIRLGDGDIVSIPLDIPNCYHRNDERIKDMYAEIIKNYSDKSPYVLSVPRFITLSNGMLRDMGQRRLNVWMPVKVMFLLRFNKKASYMDAHNFYYDDYFETVLGPLIKDKKAICVTNSRVIAQLSTNPELPWKDVTYVATPEHDAMDAYERILKEIDAAVVGCEKKDVVLLVAMGPVGKYIVYQYANKGYQGIDVGKGMEVMYTKESLEHTVDLEPLKKQYDNLFKKHH